MEPLRKKQACGCCEQPPLGNAGSRRAVGQGTEGNRTRPTRELSRLARAVVLGAVSIHQAFCATGAIGAADDNVLQ